jgi:drug/metabolite transporter (DMT)-like permease
MSGILPRTNVTTYVQLAIGMAMFGSAAPISKIVTEAMPVFIGSGLRVALGAAFLLPFAINDFGALTRFGLRDWLMLGAIALFGMFGFSVLMLYGMKIVSGVSGAVVMSTTPAVTALASIVFLRETASWRKVGAIVLAGAGVLVLQMGLGGDGAISGPAALDLWLGAALVFGAVCCEAVYTLMGKQLFAKIDPVAVACLACLLALPLFVPFAAWQWHDFHPTAVRWPDWVAVVWYGVCTLALGSWLWYSGLAKAEGSVAAGFMGVMPTSALVLSYFLLGESFAWTHLVGFATVFAGVLLISWEHARMSTET